MVIGYSFHPEALSEYEAATAYYLAAASPRVAQAFVGAVESAVDCLVAAPTRWRIVEEPGIRRYVLGRRFPYVIYYRCEPTGSVTIYAVMHCSREPGYWHRRLEENG